jgi:hypothetical protein
MLYLVILQKNQIPTEALMQQLLFHYRQSHGEDVRILGGQKVAGSLPRSSDDYVVITCLKACNQANIDFDSQHDQIAYSIDILDGEEIGVCHIHKKK